MAKESEVVREIHSLDSDMQTLVYENYNKFISATDTINKMRVDFRETVSRFATMLTSIFFWRVQNFGLEIQKSVFPLTAT